MAEQFIKNSSEEMLRVNSEPLEVIGRMIDSDEFILAARELKDGYDADRTRFILKNIVEAYGTRFDDRLKLMAKKDYYRSPDRDYVSGGIPVQVKNGWVTIHGAKFPTRGKIEAQNRFLKNLTNILYISNEELRDSPDLSFRPCRQKIILRIQEKKPLRILLDVDESRGIAVIYDFRFQTAFYVPISEGIIKKGAITNLLLIHGAGGSRSTGDSMVGPMLYFRKKFGYSAITFDTPNHGHATHSEDFHDLDLFLEWMDSVLSYLRYLAPRKAHVAIGRSHGDNVLEEYCIRRPYKLDGMVGISGYHPAWTEPNIPHMNKRVDEGALTFNQEGMRMAMAHEGVDAIFTNGKISKYRIRDGQCQWTFLKKEHQTPALKISGTKDPEYMHGFPTFILERRREAERKRQKFLVIENGSHDLLSLTNNSQHKEVYQAIKEFVEGL